MIGEGFFLYGLNYFSHDSRISKGFKASFKSSHVSDGTYMCSEPRGKLSIL